MPKVLLLCTCAVSVCHHPAARICHVMVSLPQHLHPSSIMGPSASLSLLLLVTYRAGPPAVLPSQHNLPLINWSNHIECVVLFACSMEDQQEPMQLLQLPDPCLLAVLQCCADDPRSLLSAARAHPRLHQAAVAALSSVSAEGITQQQVVDNVGLYLSKHGHHVSSVSVAGVVCGKLKLRQLPPNLQLDKLSLTDLLLQLQPGSGFQGVVQPGLPLKHLRLCRCAVLDGAEALTAALALLPGLQHLSLDLTSMYTQRRFRLPADVLSGLQQLTYLELEGVKVKGPDPGCLALQPLQALTRLAGLRLSVGETTAVTSSMLSGMQHLTRLELTGRAQLELDALAAHTQLQHLHLANGLLGAGAAGVAQLLSGLQQLQQLTHLSLVCVILPEDAPPAAAYSALTASSKLQHLEVSKCQLPEGVWQHVFPAGRQLPHLQSLAISDVSLPSGDQASAPEGSRLVTCCPGLRCLDIRQLQYSTDLLAPLQQLTGLGTLL